MADLPPNPDANDESGTPRWVKVFGIICLALVLLLGVMLLAGGGNHGPGRHLSSIEHGGK